MRRVLPLLLLVAGCPAPKQYAIQRPDVTCERAVRTAHRTLLTMGYTVTSLQPPIAENPGVIVATKPGPDGTPLVGRVRIRCTGQGTDIQPIEDALIPNYEFSRGFGYSFKSLVQRPDVEDPQKAVGLQVLLQALDPIKARLDLDAEPVRGDAVLIRVTVRNNTDRAVIVDPGQVELQDGGKGAKALSGGAVDAALAGNPAGATVRKDQLTRAPIGPNTTVVRYLLFPPGRYREAQLAVEDVETGESDGLVMRVE